MKIIKRLFGQRRWLAWLPVPAAALLSGGSPGSFFDMLLGGCIWWVPYWLAYWLSDRFTTFSEDGDPPEIIVTPGVDPVSGGSCTVVRCGRTGMPMAYGGGGGHHHRHH
jgi:hypothetical protein